MSGCVRRAVVASIGGPQQPPTGDRRRRTSKANHTKLTVPAALRRWLHVRRAAAVRVRSTTRRDTSKVASRAEGSCCESPIHDEEGHEQGCQDSSDALPTLLASTWRQSACLDRLFLEKGPYKPRQPEGAAARSGGRRVPAPRPHHTQALEANFELSDEPLGATTSFAAASPLMPVGCPPQAGHCGPGRRHHQRHHERGHAPSRHEASAEKGVSHGRKCSAQRLE
eukprot:TRINITY_DN18297_c0_g1_i2.p1 TRINITY_DN18297_c0_g1~~TRINITY_DN18297_c0_g1_i2.p1  ORF type:complete len:225 (-),score=33.90 TRINITY_DN18297_c0_g1_i2:154-828(-)